MRLNDLLQWAVRGGAAAAWYTRWEFDAVLSVIRRIPARTCMSMPYSDSDSMGRSSSIIHSIVYHCIAHTDSRWWAMLPFFVSWQMSGAYAENGLVKLLLNLFMCGKPCSDFMHHMGLLLRLNHALALTNESPIITICILSHATC